jgi:hypothetical protein
VRLSRLVPPIEDKSNRNNDKGKGNDETVWPRSGGESVDKPIDGGQGDKTSGDEPRCSGSFAVRAPICDVPPVAL